MTFTNDIDKAVVDALAGTYPTLYTIIWQLVRRGQTKAQIMARVQPVARWSPLVGSAVETTIEYLIRIQRGRA